MRRWVIIAVVLLVGACSHAPTASTDGRAAIVRVIDGDTIVVHIGGHDEHVRLLGIDTPETHKPDSPVECFGPEAAARLDSLLPKGTVVRLVRDVEARDRYDRLLAYVYRDSDGLFVDLAMVADGFAGTLTIKPNVAHRDELERAATDAQAARRGLWASCGGNHVVPAG
ncbi:MAG TPA: thermonuclease family protein [Acidimicrobiales bacterium]|nr:thermonuclease family protein [Acidimicrobiales bacterium]